MQSKLRGSLLTRRGPLRCIALGDSVTQNDSFEATSGLWTQGNGYFEQVLRANGAQQGNYVFMRNAGIGGNTTPDMLARLDTDVLAYNPDVMFLMAGTNDILPGAVDADYAAFFTALEKIIVRALLAGVDVVLSTCPTKDAAPAEVARAIPWYYLLAKHYSIPLIDAHHATADPVTGQYKAGYSDDGTHPNQTGIAAIVNASFNALSMVPTRTAYHATVASTVAGTAANLILNGNFVKNTVPPAMDNWSVNTTGASFTQDTVVGWGKVFDYVKTAAGGAYALFGASIPAAQYLDGDVLVFSGWLGASGMTGSPIAGHTFLMQFDSADSFRPINSHVVDNPSSPGEFNMEAVVPAGYGGVHDLIPQWFVQDIGTYKAAELTLWNKSAYERVYKPGLFKG
jgi:lysophospholipase L1-like esterase